MMAWSRSALQSEPSTAVVPIRIDPSVPLISMLRLLCVRHRGGDHQGLPVPFRCFAKRSQPFGRPAVEVKYLRGTGQGNSFEVIDDGVADRRVLADVIVGSGVRRY